MSIVMLLDTLVGDVSSSILIQGAFRNPMMNVSFSTFELSMLDSASFLVHQSLTGLLLPQLQVRDFPDITMISTNSSYGALSSYTFIFNNLGDIPVRFVKVSLPDCFSANFTQLVAKAAKVSGVMEFTEVFSINNSTKDFWFNCNCTNFTLISVLNAGPQGSQCVQSNKYFSLYNYDDVALTKMIFKNQ